MKGRRIALSNIAWDESEEINVIPLLNEYEISAIEVAPAKVVNDLATFTDTDVIRYKNKWRNLGFEISSMQALLFGGPNGNIFGTKKEKNEISEYLLRIIEMGGMLGATRLVFGSPKNRIRNNIQQSDAFDIAAEFFQPLANYAHQCNTMLCIEPNPKYYNCDFVNTTKEALSLVEMINHPGFGVHVDIAGMYLSEEPLYDNLMLLQNKIFHYHISEKDLAPINNSKIAHDKAVKALMDIDYQGWLSIEMKRPNANVVDTIRSTLEYVKNVYGCLIC